MNNIFSVINSNIILAIGGSLLIAIVILINKILEDRLLRITKSFLSKFKKKKIPAITNNMIKTFDLINSELGIIKSELNSDRAYIFEFHNGDYFISKNSRYKLSRTYEKVTAGVSIESVNLQSIDVTLIWDNYLKPFFVKLTEEELPFGFSYIKSIDNKCNICKFNEHIMLINVELMDSYDGPSKFMLENQGIKYSILLPIISSNGIIYGILGFDYMNTLLDLSNIKLCNLCRLSKQIGMLWENDEHLKTDAMNYKIGDYKNLE